jgi:hypothetical protein
VLIGIKYPDGRIETRDIYKGTNGPAQVVYPWQSSRNMPYNFYVKRTYQQANNTSNSTSNPDSVTPMGHTNYVGPACSGSCHQVIGNFDSVVHSTKPDYDGIVLTGWACDRTVNKSILVQARVGGLFGLGGTVIGQDIADTKMADAAKIRSLCGGTTVGHRFKILIPRGRVTAYRGEPIWLNGVSASGGSNLSLGQSGKLSIPTLKGHLDAASGSGIRGWACEQGLSNPVRVLVYAYAPRSSGQPPIAAGYASLASDSGVKAECNNQAGHRFNIVLPKAVADKYRGKAIFLYGVSNTGAPVTSFSNFSFLK